MFVLKTVNNLKKKKDRASDCFILVRGWKEMKGW